MHTRDCYCATLTLLAGLFFAVAALSPISTLAQRPAETAESASSSTTRTMINASEPAPKSAHTPATTITDENGNVILEISEGGSLLAPDNGGAIPVEGEGTRMMWYPSAGAFRAGEVNGSNWDADSIGSNSVAFGFNTKATGDFGSIAMGDNTEASALSATAMGFSTVANGINSTALGKGTYALGKNATATGLETSASDPSSFAMGTHTLAGGVNAVAMGFDTEASDSNAVAAGTLSEARGANAVAMGLLVDAASPHSTTLGRCNISNPLTISNSLLVVGNGSPNSAGDSCSNRSDALELDDNGDMRIAGSLTENSDRRLKTDIDPLGEGTLQNLHEINPVRFRFKNEKTHPSGEQIGLIAQEVQNEFPELVTEQDDGMLSLSYTKFSAVLLKGMQEQQSTIEEQQAQISDLKAENEQIKERLAALEAEQSAPATAGLFGAWGVALVLGLGGLAGGVLWRRRS